MLVTEKTGDFKGVRPTQESALCTHAHAQVRLPLLRFQRPAIRTSNRRCNSYTTALAEIRCGRLQVAAMVMHSLASNPTPTSCAAALAGAG